MAIFDWARPRSRGQPEKSNVIDAKDELTWEQMKEIFAVPQTGSGVSVNDKTAMKVTAVFRCVTLIAGAIATMNLEFIERKGGRKTRIDDHELSDLFNVESHPLYSAASFWELITSQMLLKGDGIAPIARTRTNRVDAILPVDKNDVLVERRDGRNIYFIKVDGMPRAFDQDDVIHFPGAKFDGLESLSVIRAAAESIGIATVAQDFSGRFFKQGATASVALETEKNLKTNQITELRQQWEDKYSGSGNYHRPLVLPNGLTAKQLTIPANDAQLLESRKFQVNDISRAFGTPGPLVGEDTTSTWGTGVEQLLVGFVKFTLAPHLNRLEQEINRKVLKGTGTYCRFNADELLRGDSKSRAEFYSRALGGSSGPGWMSVNEVRYQEGLDQIDGRDDISEWMKKEQPTERAANDS